VITIGQSRSDQPISSAQPIQHTPADCSIYTAGKYRYVYCMVL